jgi:hypothetical protein
MAPVGEIHWSENEGGQGGNRTERMEARASKRGCKERDQRPTRGDQFLQSMNLNRWAFWFIHCLMRRPVVRFDAGDLESHKPNNGGVN